MGVVIVKHSSESHMDSIAGISYYLNKC